MFQGEVHGRALRLLRHGPTARLGKPWGTVEKPWKTSGYGDEYGWRIWIPIRIGGWTMKIMKNRANGQQKLWFHKQKWKRKHQKLGFNQPSNAVFWQQTSWSKDLGTKIHVAWTWMVLPVFYTNLLLVKSPLLLFSALLMEKHLAIISPYFPSKSPTICCLDPPCLAKKQYRVGEKKTRWKSELPSLVG